MEKEEITLKYIFEFMKDGFTLMDKRFDRMETSFDQKLDRKIDDLESQVKGKIDSLKSELLDEIGSVKAQLSEQIKDCSAGIDNLAFYSATKKEHRALSLRVHKLESKSAAN